jgi:hypothetical protein
MVLCNMFGHPIEGITFLGARKLADTEDTLITGSFEVKSFVETPACDFMICR